MMKKKILLTSTLIVIVTISILSCFKQERIGRVTKYGTFKDYVPTKNPTTPETSNWEYVKNRLFDGKTSKVHKFDGAILYVLKGATAQDSLTVDDLMSQLRILAPNKTIEYRLNTHGTVSEDGTFVTNKKNKKISLHDSKEKKIINLVFGSKKVRLGVFFPGFCELEDGSVIYLRQDVDPFMYSLNLNIIEFDLKKDISFEKRRDYISYFFWRSLCKIHLVPSDISLVVKPNINSLFRSAELNPIDYSFTDEDKFLLKKLYSDDFLSQFKEFLYGNHNWGYAFNFMNYSLMRSIVMTIIVLLSLLVFVLSFSLFSSKKNKYSYLNYLTPFLIVSIVIVNFYFFYSNMKYESDSPLEDDLFLGFNIIGILLAVLSSFFTWLLEKHLLKDKFNFALRLFLKASFVYLAIQLPMIIFISLLFNSDAFDYDYTLIINIALLFALGRGLLLYLNHFSESLIKEKDVELSRLKELNAQNELKSLHAHINPHFLYNALNSIASLVYESPEKTEEMTLSLSDLFKYSINRKGEKMSTISNEVEMVKNYLKIEKIRFEERLNFTIDVEDGLQEKEIPMYVLQPLIENAIKHGISKIDEDGKIALVLKMEADKLLIAISDNGPDFPGGLLCGHGLQSVYDLLRLSYGDKATLNWENTPEKRIVISITSNS